MRNFFNWVYGIGPYHASGWVPLVVTTIMVLLLFIWFVATLALESVIMFLITVFVPMYLVWNEYQNRDKSRDN